MKNANNLKKAGNIDNKYTPGSIPRMARILDCLNEIIATITDITRKIKCARFTVHRILKVMKGSSMVTEIPVNKRNYIESLITWLANTPLLSMTHFIRCITGEMEYISRLCGKTVALDILLGIQIVPLYKTPS